ncbi:MAG: lipoyl(octanoyl) transferase LipB, partial [Burkholderiales bacterium]|nr:lipoyl(octanoyl) transferase LipB [Burkholderiales bacterium]
MNAVSRNGAPSAPKLRPLRQRPYLPTVQEMQAFTLGRGADTRDEIWLVEHPPVFTLGHASRPEHLRAPGEIPVVRTERGGQVTYHGPGQVVAYLLIDLRRRRLSVRDFVAAIEGATIALLAACGVAATRRTGAPGVYVVDDDGGAGAKIASLGIRISRGCSYHGVALNVAMDLEPFSRIDPCGYPGLAVTD